MLREYEVLRTLSEGAAAEVLLARSELTHEEVIVEVLRKELVSEPDVVSRFLDAARARREMAHPNVLRRVADGITSDGRPFLRSEAVGQSLAAVLATKGPLSAEQAVRVAIGVCDALHFLHSRGHVHGNVKPATVFLPAEGATPKLVDYGLALLRPGRTLPGPRSRILVESEYLAPERVRGQRATPASDVYAVGLLLFEALTGFPPFTASDSLVTRRKQLEDRPPSLPTGCAELTPLVHKCLAKDPAQRFATVAALRTALASELEGTLPILVDVAEYDGDDEGTRLGIYELEKPLGEGGMGRVFLARHVKLGRRVALKLLKPELANQHTQVQRFFQEAQAVNRISHEHIVEIFDFVDEVTEDGQRRVYCVMELLRGRTLRELMEAEPLPLHRALRVLRQSAAALDAAHRVGVVHRDVKPDNIFVTDRGGGDFAKVLDFGVAKLRGTVDGATGSAPHAEDVWSTQAGIVVGTPAYMAPEQATGKAADHRADIYSFGVVLYRLLTGKPPFLATTFTELVHRILQEAAPDLPEVTPAGEHIPEEIRALAQSCLQKDPSRRPESMAEVGRVLEGVLAELSGERARVASLGSTVAIRPPRRRPSLAKWALAAGALFVLGAAAAAVLANRDGHAPAQSPSAAVAPPAPIQSPPMVLDAAPAAPSMAPGVARIRVESQPRGAVIRRLDTGKQLGTAPLSFEVPAAEGTLELEATLRGHGRAVTQVRTGGDGVVRFVLERAADSPKKRKRRITRDDTLNPFKN